VLRQLLSAVLGPPVAGRLPERVQAQIARDQADSEILIGWVQLAGVAFFALLYTLARKTFPADATLEPVPWALGFYFVFTVIRLVLAHLRRLPQWMVLVSIVVDIAVLIVTIWAFHIQYMQPAGFSLKGPTMLYLFGLIALRALRFDPRYVAMAGGAAVIGWSALVVYAVAASPVASAVTDDYVRYLTSPDVLIGGEVDKILTLVMVTLILFIALSRARKQLVRSVVEGQSAAELSRFFSPEIARRITGGDAMVKAGEGILRDAAVLFVDLRGFTALSGRVGPTETVRLLGTYQGIVVAAVQNHGGAIDKFLGDGVMATFGAAAPSDTYAADALAAALEIDGAMSAWNARRAGRGSRPMAWGMGLAAGTVVFGAVGDESRLEYTVIGEAVNLAAKLEKHCKACGARLCLTAEACALAEAQGGTTTSLAIREPGVVAGVAGPLRLAVLQT